MLAALLGIAMQVSAAVTVAPEVRKDFDFLYTHSPTAEFLICLTGIYEATDSSVKAHVTGWKFARIKKSDSSMVSGECDLTPDYIGTAHNHPNKLCEISGTDKYHFEKPENTERMQIAICGIGEFAWGIKHMKVKQ
jgi:hypothetical protein